MSWIHTNLVLPMFEPERHAGLGGRIRALQRFDRAPHSQQLELQAASLRKLLEHAYRTTPYYHHAFDQAAFDFSNWKSGDPLPLPALSREQIRSCNDDLRSREFSIDELRPGTTGGTTSTPVPLWRDIEGLRNKTAMQYHLNAFAGYHQGDSVLMIWGAERDLELNPSWRWKLYEQRLLRRYVAPAGQVNEATFESFLQKLNRHKPKIIYGYAGTTSRFAAYLKAQARLHHKPKSVILTAEPLSYEDRKLVEDVFECKVTEHYGSRDIGMVASQCEAHQGLHFHPAACLVEFVKAGMTAEGPLYRLLITDLLNYGMPMIRYDTQDCVLIDESTCPCGRRFPTVRSILGRVLDNFVLADGTQIPGIAVVVAMEEMGRGFHNVCQVQLIQQEIDRMEVRYAAVGDESAIAQELSKFRERVEELFKSKLYWTETRVREILRERSGKLRLCISQVHGGNPRSA